MGSQKVFGTFCSLVLAIAFLTGLNVDRLAAAEKDYPNRIVTLINCWGPGGGIDIAYRPILDVLPDYLRQKIIMSHHSGAGGAIGAAFAAKAKPDGYTILAGSPSTINVIPATRKVPYSLEDFVSVGTFEKGCLVLLVKSDAPWKTLQEFVADAKKKAGTYKCSTYGVLGQAHFCMELFTREAGIKVVNIPHASDAPSLAATIGGHTQLSMATIQSSLPQIESGVLRALAVSDSVRYPYLPDVPTFKEWGYNIRIIGWFGMLVPKGTPKGIIDTLYNAQKRAFADNKIQPVIEKIGMTHHQY